MLSIIGLLLGCSTDYPNNVLNPSQVQNKGLNQTPEEFLCNIDLILEFKSTYLVDYTSDQNLINKSIDIVQNEDFGGECTVNAMLFLSATGTFESYQTLIGKIKEKDKNSELIFKSSVYPQYITALGFLVRHTSNSTLKNEILSRLIDYTTFNYWYTLWSTDPKNLTPQEKVTAKSLTIYSLYALAYSGNLKATNYFVSLSTLTDEQLENDYGILNRNLTEYLTLLSKVTTIDEIRKLGPYHRNFSL